jgi:CheY-like chemotaxis protein/molybdopterin converting factor small subunit
MRTIIVDNNTAYAEALAEDIEDDSESLLSGEGPSTLDEVEDKLNTKIKNLRDKNENSASLRVLINRELKLQGRKRQETLGQSLYQGVTWQYLEVPFFLYAFQQAPESEEIPFVRLPFTPADIPSQSKEERIDSKIAAFLEHFADVHEKVQHGLGDAPATPVNVVRLLNGAAQAGVIRSAEQWMMLRDFLEGEAFSTDGKGEIELLTDDIAHLSDLYFARAEAWDATNEDGEGQRIEKNVVVIDDEVDDEGESLWAGALSIIFEREGFRFSAKRPSEVQKDVATLRSEGADMVLLDIDFRQDPDYEGEREFGGLDLLSTIQEALPHVPVVMMSIYDQIGLYEKCKQHGCYDYLTKAWGTYAKHRTSESEKEWFESWRKAIEVPLRYEAFFKDVDLHEKQEIVPPTSIENLQAALRDIGNPTARTARTLAGFFEDFVFSYLAYRRLEAGDLADALNTAVIEESEQELLAVSNILRVMRNKIFHYGSYMNERLDTWLFLTLQRVFVMRLIKPVNLEDLSWLNVITEDFYLELEDCQFDADKSLFEKHEYIWSQENDSYLRKRAQALENLIGKRTLELEEFRSHAQLFIKSLTALFPKAAISQVVEVSKLGDFEPVGSLLDSIISQESHAGIGLKRGYEILSPIYWLIESRDNRSALMQSKSNHDYEKRLR